MKHNTYFRAIALVLVLTVALIAALMVKAFAPFAVLPHFTIPNMVLFSLLALLLDHYLVQGEKTIDAVIILVGAAAFGLLPFAAGFVTAAAILRLVVVGGLVFTLTAWLFGQLQERFCGKSARLAPLFSALGLYLAAQCFSGMIF